MKPVRLTLRFVCAGILGAMPVQRVLADGSPPALPVVAELYDASGVCYDLTTDGRATVVAKGSGKPVLFRADDEVFCESGSFAIIRYIRTNRTFRINYPGWQPIGNPGPADGGPGPYDPARLGRQTSVDPKQLLNAAVMVASSQTQSQGPARWWYQDLFTTTPLPTKVFLIHNRLIENWRIAAYSSASWAYVPATATPTAADYSAIIVAQRLQAVAQIMEALQGRDWRDALNFGP